MSEIGHNHPPSPLDEVLATYDDVFDVVRELADDGPIETDEKLKSVETTLMLLKEAREGVAWAKEKEYRPYKKAADEVTGRYNPVAKDIEEQIKCVIALINPYKQKLLEAQQEATRIANEAAALAEQESREAAAKQVSGSIDDARGVSEKATAAHDAKEFAKKVAKPTVKGMRTKRIGVILDYKAFLNWLAVNDKDFLRATMDNYAEIHVRNNRCALPGVRVDITKESF